MLVEKGVVQDRSSGSLVLEISSDSSEDVLIGKDSFTPVVSRISFLVQSLFFHS